ncbi:glycoside hydrolase family 127 protein [Martelella lutilitoris]|uniref:Glycoside hydrolase family 127 protein n=1 Tax=Martelella lutilitoris TaxID=2583532 RepID=A0A5C4JQR2_9HYPH|nr:beta-L-arabinofuranosidase domain-containing protein [Martelella lutilitoris]TNB47617.1 glycoside hydrolase family 127 protein [Martelella lutilitoris]
MNKPFNAGDALQPKSKFRPLSVNQVEVGGFFGPRVDVVATTTAKLLFDRCIEARMLEQVDPDLPNPGIVIPFDHGNTVTTQMFWDSDFGKSIETAAYALNRKRDEELEARVDAVIDAYGRLQAEDGYLNSWYQRIQPGQRWTNLRDRHELYNAGHLIEGAVAYYHATGKRKFLDIMCRYADCIDATFGADANKKRGYPGHPELELALVKLGRVTGEQRYLDLAKFFVDERGREPKYFDQEAIARGEKPEDFHFTTLEYCQAHKPVREQREVVGHAVRAAYLYAGMADVATEFSDESLDPALEALWSHLTDRNLYVTGGFGPSKDNEGLTFDYDLPNETAYAETCAAVALVFWASRMLGRAPDARFADVMERALYNGALSGLSEDGTHFFYDNPLESYGNHHRWRWHRCPCCPPNISRLVASIGTYFYGVAEDELALHLYCENAAEIEVAGTKVGVKQETAYPKDGRIAVTLTPEAPVEFTLSLRVPGWARGFSLAINGEASDATPEKGYLRIRRQWQAGDTIELDLEMQPEMLYAHPKVAPDQGRAALLRGPLIYCVEETDNKAPLNAYVVKDGAPVTLDQAEGLGDTVALSIEALVESQPTDALYATTPPERTSASLKAIPYYLWDNRAPGEMLVWLRREA